MAVSRRPSPQQIPPLRRGFLARLPVWFKALFIKFWFAGAVFYFIGWGLMGLASADQLDLTLALGLVLGLVTDLLVNRVLFFLEGDRREFRGYMIAPVKKFYTIPINLLFGVICSFLVAYTYHLINYIHIIIHDLPDGVIWLGAEPLMFGFLYLCFDMLFVGFRHMLCAIIRRARGLEEEEQDDL